MLESGPAPHIFISAAEQSGDEHAASLIRAFTKAHPKASFAGLTGPNMRAAGCRTFHDMTAGSAMALAVIRRVPEALRLLYRLRSFLADQKFDAAVLVDSPTLNLPIANLCRRRSIPVLYYIAPQTWAWAPWRNRRIRRRVNRLACIWPFEEEYFRAHDIPATYVGHPSFEHLLALDIDEERVAHLRAGHSPLVTLLPGSRRHVVQEVLPGQLDVAQVLKKRFPHARFLVVPANDRIRRLIEAHVADSRLGDAIQILPANCSTDSCGTASCGADPCGTGVPPVSSHISNPPTTAATQRAEAIRAADLVLVASGTATLEVAYHATPMIVMYNASRWMYHLFGRWLISTKHLSIPNILAGRRLVPEFMPYYRTTDPITATAVEWLSTPATLARIRQDLTEVIKPIIKPGAAKNTAAQLQALLAETRTR